MKWQDEANGHRWDDDWITGSSLRKDGLGYACDVVDQWKASSDLCFYSFCAKNGHVHVIGDSPEGTCAFYALRISVTLLGAIFWFSDTLVDEFKEYSQARGYPISTKGISYGEIRHFIKFANKNGRPQIRTKVLDKNLIEGANGKKAKDALTATALLDSVYMCAAFTSLRVTHSFVVRVEQGVRSIYDEEHDGIPLTEYDSEWIAGVKFLRRVSLF